MEKPTKCSSMMRSLTVWTLLTSLDPLEPKRSLANRSFVRTSFDTLFFWCNILIGVDVYEWRHILNLLVNSHPHPFQSNSFRLKVCLSP